MAGWEDFVNDPAGAMATARSISASEDRLQSARLSAESSQNKARLANALQIAKMQTGAQRYGSDVQRYGYDVGAETARRGQDVQRYGIDLNAAVQREGLAGEMERARWQNALAYLTQAAQLRGPGDYFQYANFARGASQTDFPAFLQSLMAGGGPRYLQDFGAVSGQTPAPASIQGLANQLSTGQVGSQSTGGLLGAIDQIARGFHRLAPGALEGLTDTERALLQSGAEAGGHDWNTLMSRYAQSRIGQGQGTGA